MEENEVKIKMTEINNKLGKDSHLCHMFIKNVIAYFKKEYLVEDYDINNLEEDVCNLANSYLSMEKYKPFNGGLSDDELSFIVALIANYLEGYINE